MIGQWPVFMGCCHPTSASNQPAVQKMKPISLKRGGSCPYELFVSFTHNYKTWVTEVITPLSSWGGSESLNHFIILTLFCFFFKAYFQTSLSPNHFSSVSNQFTSYYECKPKQCICHCHKCTVINKENVFYYNSSKLTLCETSLGTEQVFHPFFLC